MISWLLAAWKARKLIARWAGVAAIVGIIAGGWLWGCRAAGQRDAAEAGRAACSVNLDAALANIAEKDAAIAKARADVAESNAAVKDLQAEGAGWRQRYETLRARPTPTPVIRTVTEVVTSTDCEQATVQAAEWLQEVLP